MKPLGLFGGAAAVFRGLRFVVITRKTWPFALVPAVILLLLFGVCGWAGLNFVAPSILPDASPDSAFARFGLRALTLLVDVVTLAGAALLSAWLTPPLSAPALERIVALRERALGVPEHPPVSFFTELWCGVRAQLVGLLVGGPALAILWLVTLLAPPAAVVTMPAKLVTVSLLVAWNLLDYPLSLRGVPMRQRFDVLRRRAPACLGFGAGIAVLFAIPLGAIVLLPAGVAAAAEIAADLERRS